MSGSGGRTRVNALKVVDKENQRLESDKQIQRALILRLLDLVASEYEAAAAASNATTLVQLYVRGYLAFTYYVSLRVMLKFGGFERFVSDAPQDFKIYVQLYGLYRSWEEMKMIRGYIEDWLSGRLPFNIKVLLSWLDEYVEYESDVARLKSQKQVEAVLEDPDYEDPDELSSFKQRFPSLNDHVTSKDSSMSHRVSKKSHNVPIPSTTTRELDKPYHNGQLPIKVHILPSNSRNTNHGLSVLPSASKYDQDVDQLTEGIKKLNVTAGVSPNNRRSLNDSMPHREEAIRISESPTKNRSLYDALPALPQRDSTRSQTSLNQSSYKIAPEDVTPLSEMTKKPTVLTERPPIPNTIPAELLDKHHGTFGLPSSNGARSLQDEELYQQEIYRSQTQQLQQRQYDSGRPRGTPNGGVRSEPRSSNGTPILQHAQNEGPIVSTNPNGRAHEYNRPSVPYPQGYQNYPVYNKQNHPQPNFQANTQYNDHNNTQYYNQSNTQANNQANNQSFQTNNQPHGDNYTSNHEIAANSASKPHSGGVKNSPTHHHNQPHYQNVGPNTQKLATNNGSNINLTVGPVGPVGPVEYMKNNGICGLRNFGSTCYINSTLQLLFGIVQFKRIFTQLRYHKHISQKFAREFHSPEPLLLLVAVSGILRTFQTHGSFAISPLKFLRIALKLKPDFNIPNEQQDAQEFLLFVLDRLHDELSDKRDDNGYSASSLPPPPNGQPEAEQASDEYESWKAAQRKAEGLLPISDLFEGHLQNKLECTRCGYELVTYLPFTVLSLLIPRHLERLGNGSIKLIELLDCIRYYIKGEILSGENAWKCPKCPKEVRRTDKFSLRKKEVVGDSTKKLLFVKLPQVLIIHLLRFALMNDKLESSILYPLELSFNAGVSYKLSGIVNHFGTLKSGHYTALVNKLTFHQSNNLSDETVPNNIDNLKLPYWCYFDDDIVHPGVAHGNPAASSMAKISLRDVYVLCYERIT